MVDRVVENTPSEVPEIPKDLEKVLLFALDEAHTLVDSGEGVTPFTALVVKDNVFIEKHPCDTPQQCFAEARHTVEGVRGATSYAFCYDGYIDTDAGMVDALIAEGGLPEQPTGMAVGLIYHEDDEGHYHFESEVAYIGEAPNFMAHTKGPEPVTEKPETAETVEVTAEETPDGESVEVEETTMESNAESPYALNDGNVEDFPTVAELEARQNSASSKQ